jgi:hypothetical protein
LPIQVASELGTFPTPGQRFPNEGR